MLRTYKRISTDIVVPANNGNQNNTGSERLQRFKNCALAYHGLDPLSVTGLAGASKWGLIAGGVGGIPKAIPEALGVVRKIRLPGSSSFTSIFSILSAASGGWPMLRAPAPTRMWGGPLVAVFDEWGMSEPKCPAGRPRRSRSGPKFYNRLLGPTNLTVFCIPNVNRQRRGIALVDTTPLGGESSVVSPTLSAKSGRKRVGHPHLGWVDGKRERKRGPRAALASRAGGMSA